MQHVVEEFLGHAERWVHVALHLQLLSLFSSIQHQLPNLQTIAFLGSPDNARESKIFENAPKLRFLSMERMRDLTELPTLPWHQLIQASLNSLDKWTVTTEVLALAPNLCSIIITDGPPLDERGWFPPPIPIPPPSSGLRKIVLLGKDAKQQAVTKVLNAINTSHLSQMFLVKCAGWHGPSIPALIERSGCCLETLMLQESQLRPTELLALLSAIPTLRTLALVHNTPSTVTNIVLNALIQSDGEAGLVPVLSTLVLWGSYLFSTDKLLKMLEVRMGPHSPLVILNITLPDREITPSDLERFAALPGVNSTCWAPVWCIFTGAYRDWRYNHDTEL